METALCLYNKNNTLKDSIVCWLLCVRAVTLLCDHQTQLKPTLRCMISVLAHLLLETGEYKSIIYCNLSGSACPGR